MFFPLFPLLKNTRCPIRITLVINQQIVLALLVLVLVLVLVVVLALALALVLARGGWRRSICLRGRGPRVQMPETRTCTTTTLGTLPVLLVLLLAVAVAAMWARRQGSTPRRRSPGT